MIVHELMTTDLITVPPDTPVLEARNLMATRHVRHLLVTDGDRLVGLITDRDIRLNLPSQATTLSAWEASYLLARLTVGATMTRSVIAAGPEWDAARAARLMLQHKIGCLPVMEGERVVGILTETDLLRAFVALAEQAGRDR